MYSPPVSLKWRSLKTLAWNRVAHRPLSLTIELTRRCNARCDYCNHWKEQKQAEQDKDDFVGAVLKFSPFAVTICGGEPFMRRDAMEIIEAVKHAPGWRYVGIITNGWFLTDDRARRLIATGIDQVNVSLNFPDARQDEDRKLPGLFARIAHVVPLMSSLGANVQLNAILMNENLDDAVHIAKLAASWGATVMYTLYSELPGDNTGHLFPPERLPRLRAVLAELKRQPNVMNARWYFDQIPVYLGGTRIPGCGAGRETLHLSPGGQVRPCAELPTISHWRDFDPKAQPATTCTACFQACRGEVQAPLSVERVAQYLAW